MIKQTGILLSAENSKKYETLISKTQAVQHELTRKEDLRCPAQSACTQKQALFHMLPPAEGPLRKISLQMPISQSLREPEILQKNLQEENGVLFQPKNKGVLFQPKNKASVKAGYPGEQNPFLPAALGFFKKIQHICWQLHSITIGIQSEDDKNQYCYQQFTIVKHLLVTYAAVFLYTLFSLIHTTVLLSLVFITPVLQMITHIVQIITKLRTVTLRILRILSIWSIPSGFNHCAILLVLPLILQDITLACGLQRSFQEVLKDKIHRISSNYFLRNVYAILTGR